MRRLPIAFTSLLLAFPPRFALSAPASNPATAPSPEAAAKIESLIPLLSADKWQIRQDAQDQLVAFGDAAIARLNRVASETTDAETRTRAEAALQLIAENRTAGVSLVTLKFKDAAPQQVVEALARQAFANIPTEPPDLWAHHPFPPITIDIDKQPFWVALREICSKTGLRAQLGGSDQHLVLAANTNRDLFDGPAVYSGPFMIVAHEAQQINAIYFAQPQNISRTLNLTFAIFAEPKLHVLSRSYTARILSATDDKQHAMADARQWSQFYPGPEVASIWTVSAPLILPREPGSRIIKLQGQCRAVLAAQSEVWEIADLLHGGPRSKSVAGRAYGFVELKQDGDHYSLKLTTARDARFGYNPDASVLRGIQVFDSAGKLLPRQHFQTTGGDQAHWEYTAHYTPASPSEVPSKLIWSLPVETQEKDINFEFKDLPLP